METASFIISLLAISLALFTYIKHDLKIKKQSELINNYQL